MIDLHCHMLPGMDDGAPDLGTALDMARMSIADGITHVACTPHILPGLYHNTGDQIRAAVAAFESELKQQHLNLTIFSGADAHICPNFVANLKSGHIPTLGSSRYVLVEPPHHTAPQRVEQFFFEVIAAGYVPILTHPERLHWINSHYELMHRLVSNGVWMQLTSGSICGSFGKAAQYWSERMLDEGLVHILATDAHDMRRRCPILSHGRDAVAKRLSEIEADHLVVTRPWGILTDVSPQNMPPPAGRGTSNTRVRKRQISVDDVHNHSGKLSWTGRLRSLFE